MTRRKIGLRIVASVLAIAAGVGGYVLYAMSRVQPFYAAAIEADAEELKSASQRMKNRVAELQEQASQTGSWQSVFTDDEVNGWLASYLKEKSPPLLPPEVADPRLAFFEGGCKIGFRYLGARLDAVISVEADAFMAANDVAGLRLRKAYLGSLPLSMSDVVDEITKGAASLELPIRWTQQDDDPVLLVSVADALSTDKELRRLERVELRNGEIRLAGKAESRPGFSSQTGRHVEATAGR